MHRTRNEEPRADQALRPWDEGRLSAARAAFVMASLLVMAAAVLCAQSADKKNPLADITMLKCSFPVAVSGSWKDWTPKADLQLLALSFLDVYSRLVDLRIGQQITAFGANVAFAPTDILNPRDIRDSA